MANRYWVGGTGTWTTTSTTNWASVSGGTAGASAPTTNDDVFFDNNSNVGTGAFTVTIGSSNIPIRSLTIGSLDGVMTLDGGNQIRVDYNITLPASNLVIGSGVNLMHALLTSAATTRTFTTGSGSFPNLYYSTYIPPSNSGSAVINLNGSLNCKDVYIAGEGGSAAASRLTFNTNNNSISISGEFNVASSTLNAGTSTITVRRRFSSNTNAIVNGSSATMTLGDHTSSSSSYLEFDLYSGAGTFTLGTLNIRPYSAAKIRTDRTHTITTCNITWGATTFFNGYVEGIAGSTSTFNTLNISGASRAVRAYLKSTVYGTRWTISAPTARTLTNVDFQDILASQTWTGTYLGDAGNNSSITFPTGTNKSAISAGNWSNTATWSSGNAPLPQDTAILNGSSGTGTITMDVRNCCGTLDCTGYTGTLTIGSNSPGVFGNIVLSTGMTRTGSTFLSMRGSGSFSVTSNGKFANGNLGIGSDNSLAQTITLNDALTLNTLIVDSKATLTVGSNNLTCDSFYSYSGSTINMGSGVWEFGNTAEFRNATVNKQTANMLANFTTFYFSSGQSFNKVTRKTGDVTFFLTGTASVTEISTVGYAIGSNTIQNTTANVLNVNAFTVDGTSTDNITVSGPFNYTGASFVKSYYLTVLNSTVTPSSTWTAVNSIDAGGNSGWTFVTEGSGNGLLFGSNF